MTRLRPGTLHSPNARCSNLVSSGRELIKSRTAAREPAENDSNKCSGCVGKEESNFSRGTARPRAITRRRGAGSTRESANSRKLSVFLDAGGVLALSERCIKSRIRAVINEPCRDTAISLRCHELCGQNSHRYARDRLRAVRKLNASCSNDTAAVLKPWKLDQPSNSMP